jgi:hypothetical protein
MKEAVDALLRGEAQPDVAVALPMDGFVHSKIATGFL